MKINKGAIIFAVVLGGIALLIAGAIGLSSLVTQNASGGDSGQDLFSSLFPFGQGTTRTPTGGATNEDGVPSGPVPVLREISREPVAGFSIISGGVQFAERDTGHIVRAIFDTLETKRLTNSTIPGIERAIWLSDNNVIFQRATTDDEIQNVLISYSTTTVDQSATTRTLSNFTSATPVPGKNRLILSARTGGTTVLSTTDFNEGVKKTLFSSPLRSWRVFPAGEATFIQTAPSDDFGFLYRVLSDGGLERLLGNTRGLLVSAREDGDYFAISSVTENSVRLSFIDGSGKAAGESPLATFAEKCAWFRGAPRIACGIPQSLEGSSVEAWLMGLQSFNDSIWVISPEDGTATFVRNLESEAGRPIDVIDPKVSPDGRYLIFKNKNDLSLWSLDLQAQ